MNNEKGVLQDVDLQENGHEEIGDNHLMGSLNTPLREDAFDMDDQEKIDKIAHHFSIIMETLGLDITDESLSGTPQRVGKMYVKEIFKGLDPKRKPIARKFSNHYRYEDMVIEKNIQVFSFCEHHFLPFIGKAHVAYMSGGEVIGLSKINRIVDYYSRRPQVQERLTLQIAAQLEASLESSDVAVFIESRHFCVSMRGIQDTTSTTITTDFRGAFREPENKQRFLDLIRTDTEM
ncbi:MAG: GTP cyclohydrolase I FolE [Balneolaceae bacterium]